MSIAAIILRRLVVIVVIIHCVVIMTYRRRRRRMGKLRRQLRLRVHRLFFLCRSVFASLLHILLWSASVYTLQRRQLAPFLLIFIGNSRYQHCFFIICIRNVVFISAVISVWHNELLSMLEEPVPSRYRFFLCHVFLNFTAIYVSTVHARL